MRQRYIEIVFLSRAQPNNVRTGNRLGGVDENVVDLRGLMFQVGAAAMQCIAAGHADEARKILGDARRSLYKILAEDEPTQEA